MQRELDLAGHGRLVRVLVYHPLAGNGFLRRNSVGQRERTKSEQSDASHKFRPLN